MRNNPSIHTRLIALLMMLLFVLVLPSPANAQEGSSAPEGAISGLTMEAEAAFGGNFKYGEWLPIWVQLENTGAGSSSDSGQEPNYEVRVRVTSQQGITTYIAPVSLPAGSRKRIPVYVLPNAFSHELEVQLVSGEGLKLSQNVDVLPQPNINYLVGIIASKRGALSLINLFSIPGIPRSIVLIDLPLSDLPDRTEGLRLFDTLVLNDVDTSTLTVGQQTALEDWVRQGGRLVVGGGAGAARTVAGLPETVLPLTLQGVTEVSELPALAEFARGEAVRVPGPFVVASGQPGGDGRSSRTLVEQDGTPLAVEWFVNNGFVDFIALDLTISPFDAWNGTANFWTALLSPSASFPEWLPYDMSVRQTRANSLTYALSNIPTLDLPSIRGLGILLIVYVLLVGPVNYLVLRWRRRLHLAWITIPVATLIFTGGAFGVGYALRGTDVIINKIAIVEVQPDGRAYVSSFMGLFSPARSSYQVGVSGNGLLSPMVQEYDPWTGMPTTLLGEAEFVQRESPGVRNLTVNQWSMQNFMMEEIWPDFGSVVADVELDGQTLSGAVRNETAFAISDAVLALGSQFTRLGDLAPGEVVSVEMTIPTLVDQPFGPSLSYKLFQDILDKPLPQGPPRDIQLKQNILDNLFMWGNWYGPILGGKVMAINSASNTRLMLLGWLDQAPPEVRVADRQPATQTTALMVQMLPFRYSEGEGLYLPPGLIPGSVVEINDGGYCGPMGIPAVYQGREEIVFEFQIPATLPASTLQLSDDIRIDSHRIEALIVYLGSEGEWVQTPALALFDWSSEDWVEWPDAHVGQNVIGWSESLVSQDGKVQVRLTPNNFGGGGCVFLAMGLEGK